MGPVCEHCGRGMASSRVRSVCGGFHPCVAGVLPGLVPQSRPAGSEEQWSYREDGSPAVNIERVTFSAALGQVDDDEQPSPKNVTRTELTAGPDDQA